MNTLTRPYSLEGEAGRRPRVALISHIYLEKRNRAKLNYLAQSADLTVISPDTFPWPYGTYRADFSEDCACRARVYPCCFPLGVHTSTRWILASRDLGFRRLPPDIIHVENEANSFSLLQALLYRRLYAPRAKLVVFIWANQRLRGVKGIGLDALARLMRPGIEFYIAGNTEGKVLLVGSGVPAEQVAVFPLVGTDVEYFTPAPAEERVRLRRQAGFAPGEFVIGFVGRLVLEKGVPDLLQAFQQLRQQADGARLRLLCVGEGPLKTNLLACQPDVVVASPGGNGQVLPYYQMMDVLVLPSRTMSFWKEQFGLVLVEAMACGVPVIGSNSGAIPEVIGDAGLVFLEGNVRKLARHLQSLKTSPDLRYRLSELGKHRVTEEYSAEQVACKTLAMYQQLLARSGSSIA